MFNPEAVFFSDSWGVYLSLNELGYEHYTVVHKSNFKQCYQNVDTGQIVECHTNKIEGAWKHCKDHFRRKNGTNTKLFEQHLAEIVWRNHTNGKNKYKAFFDLVKSIYTLHIPRRYTYPTPLFPSWTPPTTQSEKQHRYTILQESNSDSPTESDEDPQSEPVASLTRVDEEMRELPQAEFTRSFISRDDQPLAQAETTQSPTKTASLRSPVRSTVSSRPVASTSRQVDDRFITVRKKTVKPAQSTSNEERLPKTIDKSGRLTKTKGKGLVCPKQYKPISADANKPKKKTTQEKNPYTKSQFVFQFSSSDSDFQ